MLSQAVGSAVGRHVHPPPTRRRASHGGGPTQTERLVCQHWRGLRIELSPLSILALHTTHIARTREKADGAITGSHVVVRQRR